MTSLTCWRVLQALHTPEPSHSACPPGSLQGHPRPCQPLWEEDKHSAPSHTHTDTYTHTHTLTLTYTHTHTHTHIHTHTHSHSHTLHVHICTHTHTIFTLTAKRLLLLHVLPKVGSKQLLISLCLRAITVWIFLVCVCYGCLRLGPARSNIHIARVRQSSYTTRYTCTCSSCPPTNSLYSNYWSPVTIVTDPLLLFPLVFTLARVHLLHLNPSERLTLAHTMELVLYQLTVSLIVTPSLLHLLLPGGPEEREAVWSEGALC